MKNVRVFLTLIPVLFAFHSNAANCNSQNGSSGTPSNWGTNATWSCGNVPGNGDVINVTTHYLTSTGLSYQWGNQVITIGNGTSSTAYVKVSGNFDLYGSSEQLVVDGGTLEVTGTLTVANGASLVLKNGAKLIVNNLTLDNSASFTQTSGTITINGNVNLNSGTFTTSSAISVGGNLTIGNGSTVNASNVGGNISLSSSSKLNLTTTNSLTPSSISLSGSSELNFSGGTLTYNNTLSMSNTSKLTLTAGTMNLKALDADGTVAINGGTLAVTNQLKVNSSFTSANGSTITTGSLNITNSGGSSMTVNGSMTVSTNVTEDGPLTNNGTITVTGNYTSGGGGSSITTNNGTLNINGNVSVPSAGKFILNPGAKSTVGGSFTTTSNQNLVVGTSATPPPYADMVIKGNLISTGSGDVLVDKNGRLAVFGSMTANGSGGTIFTINSGGQVFVNGNMTFNGGGDHIVNNNSSVPYGLYVGGTVTYPGGGSTTGHTEQSIAVMKTDDNAFYNWVAAQSGSPLPITLVYFKASKNTSGALQLAWATATELNFDKFVIERSADGEIFLALGEQVGAGRNIEKLAEYSFIDTNPLVGRSYYRLKSVDLDGNYEYSNVVMMNFKADKRFTAYPNPADGNSLSVAVNFEVKPTDFIQVFDNCGGLRYEGPIESTNTKIMFTQTLTEGIYMIRLTSSDDVSVTRFVVKTGNK